MSEEGGCSDDISKRKHTSYNLDMKLDVNSGKQKGKFAMDIACALQIPLMMIHTILRNADEIETKALNLLKYSKVKITHKGVKYWRLWRCIWQCRSSIYIKKKIHLC
jgi:hypothetical protein